MTDYTSNFSFELIDFNLRPWSDKDHANWTALDRILGTVSVVPNNKGLWRSNTVYAVGDYALDGTSFVFYQCQVAHTSPATGTFSDARTANTSYWSVINNSAGNVKYDQVQALTAAQKTQALANIGGQTSLGFTPAQQGGGVGQVDGNKINIGAASGVGRLSVNATDLGRIWTDSLGATSNTTNGYHKLPSGLIIQWGLTGTTSGLEDLALPIAFPNSFLLCSAFPYLVTPAANESYTAPASPNGLNRITVYKRYHSGGTISAGSFTANFLAIGW